MVRVRKPEAKTLIRGGLVVSLALAAQVVVGSTPATAAGIAFTVTATHDIAASQGACGNTSIITPPAPDDLSLREAICLANNVGGTANVLIPAGTFTLSSGQLKVGLHPGQNITLSGVSAASTIIDAAGTSRVLDFDDSLLGGIVGTVSNVTIKNGADSAFGGGGIIGGSANASMADTLSIDHTVITNNSADAATPSATNKPGGGVQFIGGTLSITNSVISNNSSASSPGSGVAYVATGTTGEHLTVTNTTFSGNSATNVNGTAVTNGGALDLRGAAATFTVSDSKFVNNSVVATTGGALGGAIRQESGHLVLSRSNFTGNSVSGGSATPAGGAVETTTGTATMNYNRFVGNTAGLGSAIHVGTGAGAVDASENWFGCNGGPGAIGCDTVAAVAPATAVVTPRLVLITSAAPSTVTGPNATAAVTGSFGVDSALAPVSSANLTVFDSLPMTFASPHPSPATVNGSATSATAAFTSGLASVTYNSQTASGAGYVLAEFDNVSALVPITVNRAPVITTNPSTQSVHAGDTVTFTAAASGYPTPTVQWQRSTDGGGSFTNIAGATSTTYSFTAALGDNGNQYRAVFTNSTTSATTTAAALSVNEPPAFTSAATATFVAGAAGSFTITTSGVPTVMSIAETGTLPAGLSYVDNGNGTATISGTPAAGTGGTYTVTLTAVNGVTPNGTQNLTVQVNQAPAITTNPSDQTVNPGSSVSFTAAASGVPTPTVQWQRSTDGGGSFSNIAGATSTTYTFTTAAGDDGNEYRAVFTNSASSATTTAASLRVGTAPAFTSIASTVFAVGSAGSYNVSTSGVPNASLTASGSVPAWLTLTDNGNGTGTLTGTAPTGAGGQYTFTLNAANGFSPDASQTFTLSVDESPTITSTDHATFTVGTAGSFAVTTSPGFPLSTFITRTGALPSGVSFVDHGDGTATLAGTPDLGTAGIYTITITAGASGSVTADRLQTFTLTVDGPPVISTTDHATFTVGSNGTFTVQTIAGVPTATTLTRTGTLPTGVTFVDNGDGTATLSGTSAIGQGGVYPITITASNGIAPNATQAFVLTVNEPPKITSADNVTFAKGTLGAFTVTTSAGQPTTTSLSASLGLPPGVTFADNGNGTATISGVPTADGVYAVTITAGNGVAPSPTQTFTVTVTGAPTITSASSTTFAVNASGTFTVTTTAGTPTATNLSKIGGLPAGVTFVDNGDGTATLAGTPALGTGGQYPITITAANAVTSSTAAFTLTVTELPAINSANHATFTVGSAGAYAVTTVAGFPSTTALTETGALPGGVTFVDNGNGTATLAGTPIAGSGGSYPVTFTATNAAGHTDLPFTLTVRETPVITSADHTTFTVGSAGTFAVTTGAGFPTGPSLVKTGALPGGVTFVDNGNGTATLAGTPNAGTGGDYPLTITASNGVTTESSQSFTLTVDQAPVITSADHVTLTANSPGTFTVTTTGFPAAAVTETGSLPSGLTFTDNGDGTATLTGTPDPGTGGTYPLTLTAANTADVDTQAFTLTVHQGPAITSSDHTEFTVGSAGTFAVTTSGVPNATITETGTLPSGVSLVSNSDGTATLAGTPDAATGGVYPITFTASNGVNPDAVQSFTLTVDQAPAITTADHATFTVGTAGTFTVSATGYPHPSFTETGAVPAGVTLTDNGDGTATLSGTPDTGTGGSYPIVITASNGVGPVAVQSFTLTVHQAPAITSSDHTTFTVGTAGSFGVAANGVPNATITEAGTLPGGVTLVDHGDGTATLAGTPDPATGGTYPITFTATNGVNPDAVQSFTLTVDQAPAITSTDHTTFTVGTAGNLTVTANGYPHASFTHSGALPSGVTLTDNNDGTATLGGAPDAGTAGSYPITISASNGVGSAATQSFTLTVVKAVQAITVTSAQPTSAAVGDTYNLVALSDSGLTVSYSVDATTTNSACSLTSSTVSFDHAGSCVIDFDQAGDGTYAAAPRVQQTIAVSTIGTSVAVASSISPTVFGQVAHATATITAVSGTPAGTVQFAVDGNPLGTPVTVSGGAAVSPDLTDAGGDPLEPGSHNVTATFTPDDTTTYAISQGVLTQIVNPAATTLALSVHSTTIAATVAVAAPGVGTPTGSVAFTVGGVNVGSATLTGGVATLHYTVPAGKTQQVAAFYQGVPEFTGSSYSTARSDPTITATVTSASGRTHYLWYRGPVTVTFHCTTHGAPLTAACPAAVHLTRSGAGQPVTRTITATDGGVKTVVVKGINIDLIKPTVNVTGIKNAAVYDGMAPTAHCVAKDTLSGVAACTITRHVSGTKTTYKATATDKAGNTTSVSGSYTTLGISLGGANLVNGAFNIKLGHTYTLVVYASSQPRYYDAAPYPQKPTKRDKAMRSAGRGRWTLGVTMTRSMSHYRYWNLGVKIGRTMHVIKIRVS
jgi:hypothetical protein